MGNSSSIETGLFSTEQKQLLVRTLDLKQINKGGDAHIQVILTNKSGRKTRPISLDCKLRNDDENGQMDHFPIDLR